MKTLLIDNYDSFTFNLFQFLAEVNGEEPVVVRNDGAAWSELETWEVDNIVISPGPGRPDRESDFGVCADAIREARIPLLGVCLGHQGIGHVEGGSVVHAPEVMHGRLSAVHHDDSELFAGIPQGFEVVRYHSLCVQSPLPAGLEATAWTTDGVIMAMRHRSRPVWGVQFHPESICTSYGLRLLENFRDLTERAGREGRAEAPPGRAAVSVVPHGPARPAEQPAPSLTVEVRTIPRLYDTEQAFAHLYRDEPYAFWLDSSKLGDGRARFSFMGGSTGPLASVVTYDVEQREVRVARGEGSETFAETIFDYVARELARIGTIDDDLPFDFNCGFVGYLGYELKADCGGSVGHPSRLPDSTLVFADRLLAFDHVEEQTYLLCLVDEGTAAEGARWLDETARALETLPALEPIEAPESADDALWVDFYLSRSSETYLDDILRCKEYLADGETYEVCLTNKVKTRLVPADQLELYRMVRHVNPAPFSAFLRLGDAAVVSSSPERFLKIGRDRWAEAKPIKGTCRRGHTPEEDAELAEELRTGEKNRAENLMITDLLRNDLGLVCEIGSVHVPHLMAVETYETLHQLVSTIRGRVREDLAPTDCIRACFPGGSMTGAPKIRTMELIDELEQEARGVYSGALGYIGLSGGVDLNIVIRTIVMDGEMTSIGMGGAIVMQSDPEEEYQETLLKAEALMRAIALNTRDGSATGGRRRPTGDTGELSLLEAARQIRQGLLAPGDETGSPAQRR